MRRGFWQAPSARLQRGRMMPAVKEIETHPDRCELDGILGDYCEDLQLTDPQYAAAESHYLHVGRWLDEADGPLLGGAVIEPQGSMRLRTTVRPIDRTEYDLDLLAQCPIDPRKTFAHELYEAIRRRIAEHGDLKNRLEPLGRCLRLNYAGQFHLDVVPACPHPAGGLYVPDSTQRDATSPILSWKASDPIGYADWFEAKAKVREPESARVLCSKVAPLPRQEPPSQRLPLRHIVQLLKRCRDIWFMGKPRSPSSIAITTLASHAYRGTNSLWRGLNDVVGAISNHMRIAAPGRIEVLNPTNPSEDLAAPMSDEVYVQFRAMMYQLEQRLAQLNAATGVPRVVSLLEAAFEPPGGDRIRALAANRVKVVTAARDAGSLGISGTTGALSIIETGSPSADTKPIRKQNFYGD